jgi:predicted transcriptional regulator YdeE
MKTLRCAMILIITLIMTTGCSKNKEQTNSSEKSPEAKEESTMEPKIINRDSFKVAGISMHVTPQNNNTENYSTIWKDFESYHDQLKANSADKAYYGVQTQSEEGAFDYLAGMAIKDITTIAEGLTVLEIPAARYAVFECSVDGIGKTYQFIFGQWLPLSQYEISGSSSAFEQYPPENEQDAPVLIHIPIKDKN